MGAPSRVEERALEVGLRRRIEAAVGLVEHNKTWAAKQGASEADTLLLSRRKYGISGYVLRIVAVGQLQNKLVHTRQLGRFDDMLIVVLGFHARDILFDGT